LRALDQEGRFDRRKLVQVEPAVEQVGVALPAGEVAVERHVQRQLDQEVQTNLVTAHPGEAADAYAELPFL